MSNKGRNYFKGYKDTEIVIGPLRIVGPRDVISAVIEFEETYKILSKILNTQYTIEFVRRKGDLPVKGKFFKHSEANFELSIVRDGLENFYIYTRGYSPRIIVDKLLFFCLLELGFVRIHGGGIQVKNAFQGAVLLAGKGGVGKTSIILNLVLTDPLKFRFLGDDIIAVNEEGIVYPLIRKINIYNYHSEILKLEEVRRLQSTRYYLRKLVSLIINSSINAFRKVFKISYEIPYIPDNWIGEFHVRELFENIIIGTPDVVRKVFYLSKSDSTFNIVSLSKDKILSFIINETLAEETWGHVNKFYGLATNIFNLNPSLKMYEILNKALDNAETYLVHVPNLQKHNLNEIIHSILKSIKEG